MVSGRISISRLNCLIILPFFFVGCASLGKTKPNEPYKGPYPTSFNEIKLKNPLLAIEIGKLPEILDGISPSEAAALEEIVDLYNKAPEDFDKAFTEMFQTGLPNVRKYCTPLQALFWLAEDGEVKELAVQIRDYDLRDLLYTAWYMLSNTGDRRREDPESVIDRLNSPELFQYWFLTNFSYDWNRFRPFSGRKVPQSAVKTIRRKTGVCHDYAFLAYKCLRKAGYNVTTLNAWYVIRGSGGAGGHAVCLIEKKNAAGQKMYYITGDTNRPRAINGPFKNPESAAKWIAGHHGLQRYAVGMFGWH
jgi:hypothetical protein